ncbi:hypothetical protein DDZ15_14585 [Rhodohalobacter mucosus]|uniref:Uncharacterized protein n=1 Tax=Rhodohalobacter mucosus TaxID=2079485 RepID=A0A316TNE4_9BACT|nr:hypothetical protein DDZ15_14585 [Rhodohalobacter mucosus]
MRGDRYEKARTASLSRIRGVSGAMMRVRDGVSLSTPADTPLAQQTGLHPFAFAFPLSRGDRFEQAGKA